MNSELTSCVRKLADIIEEDDEGSAIYSGHDAFRRREELIPVILDGLDLSPDDFRISIDRLESEFSTFVLEAAQAKKEPSLYIEENLDDFRTQLYDDDLEEYHIAFPLNYRQSACHLIPDSITIEDIEFNRQRRKYWQSTYLPREDESEKKEKLNNFLSKSPNKIDHSQFTYWDCSYRARDQRYAVYRTTEVLEILLGLLNYSMWFGRAQQYQNSNEPWPKRWAQLREPFIYLLHSDEAFLGHYWPNDATLRKPTQPHSAYEERFTSKFELIPTFENEYPLDGRLLNAIRAFQAAITNTTHREAFFEFWRGIEILSLVGKDERMDQVVARATALLNWEDTEIANIRTQRVQQKRNQYVHEGNGIRITTSDRNLLKLFLEKLIELYIDKRDEWSHSEMKFMLSEFTTNEAKIDQLVDNRKSEVALLEWMHDISSNSQKLSQI